LEDDALTYCKNCESEIVKNYCQECGQKASVNQVTFKETIDDFIESVFSINAPLFKTLKYLIVNPGALFNNFLLGKRKRYYKPVAFFVLTTIIYLLIRSLIGFDPLMDTSVSVNSDDEMMVLARENMLMNSNNFLFLFVFSLSVFLKLFFYKTYALAEFVVVSFYIVGIYTLLITINLFFIQFVNAEFQAIAFIFMAVYFIYAMITFLKIPKILIVIKATILFFLATAVYQILAFLISYLIVFIKN
tara:strand:+ start:5421 stop:6158 length:738 start_codon:yes stop_codon:yes gene_type:complete